MGFLNVLGGIASAVTGNPTWGLIGGLIDGGDAPQVPSGSDIYAQLPSWLQGLGKLTAEQLSAELQKAIKGEQSRFDSFKNIWSDLGINIPLTRPELNIFDYRIIEQINKLPRTKQIADEIQKIYDNFDKIKTDLFEKGLYTELKDWTNFEQYIKKLIPNYNNLTSEVLKHLFGNNFPQDLKPAFESFVTVSDKLKQIEAYDAVNAEFKRNTGFDLSDVYKMFNDTINKVVNVYAPLVNKQDFTLSEIGQVYQQIKKGEIPFKNFGTPEMPIYVQDQLKYLKDYSKPFIVINNGKVYKWIPKAQGYTQLTPDAPEYKNLPIERVIMLEKDINDIKKIDLDEKTKVLQENLVKLQNQIKNYGKNLPEWLKPVVSSDYPGDLSVETSPEEKSIEQDLKNKLSELKSINEYNKVITDITKQEIGKEKDKIINEAKRLGYSGNDVLEAFYFVNKNNPNFTQTINQNINARIEAFKTSLPVEARGVFDFINSLDNLMKSSGSSLSEIMVSTPNEEFYKNLLKNIADKGIDQELNEKMYKATESVILKQAKDVEEKIKSELSARGLGNSTAITDQILQLNKEVMEQLKQARQASEIQGVLENFKARMQAIEMGLKAEDDTRKTKISGLGLTKELTSNANNEYNNYIQSLQDRLLQLKNTQEARERVNQQNFYNEFLRRLQNKQNLFTQASNLYTQQANPLINQIGGLQEQQYLANLQNAQNRNDLIARILAGLSDKSKNTTGSIWDRIKSWFK